LTGLAQENLKKALSKVQFYEKAGFKFAQTGNGLEATLLLLDAFWEHVESEIGNPVAAMAPHRDWILMCDSTKPAVLQEMRAESQRQFDNAQDNHLLSTQVMLRGPQGWSLLAA
jgi:uncharacterized protein YtpQ (UPF0354 family)